MSPCLLVRPGTYPLQRFCAPSHPGLPLLFDKALASALAPYRRFRHVVFHSYGFQLDWDRMAEGVANVQDTFSQLRAALSSYLATIGVQNSHSSSQS
jgi:hypothetical protein